MVNTNISNPFRKIIRSKSDDLNTLRNLWKDKGTEKSGNDSTKRSDETVSTRSPQKVCRSKSDDLKAMVLSRQCKEKKIKQRMLLCNDTEADTPAKAMMRQLCLQNNAARIDANLIQFLDACIPKETAEDRMDAINLQDDIIDFLESKASCSNVFASILECTEIYMEPPAKYPSASSTAISKIPFTRIYPFDRKKYEGCKDICAICTKRLIDGVALSRMSCGHVYHINCIVSWLGNSCACPVCRYEIETSDPMYEIGRRQRMASRKTYTCKCSSQDTHRCVFPDEITNQLVSCGMAQHNVISPRCTVVGRARAA